MKKYSLEVNGVQKKYNERIVLSDVYLKCETGEIIGLFGRNGSGKSTLMKIMVGIVSAKDTCIKIDLLKRNKKTVLNEISYLHQEQFIPNHLSVEKVISLSIDKYDKDVFCEDKFVKPLLRKKIRHLSGGELRYLEIKIVLSNPSKFVLLDEPFRGLTPLNIEAINDLIQQNAFKKGIIITDHNYKYVLDIATRLMLIKDGKTHQLDRKEQLVEMNYLKSL